MRDLGHGIGRQNRRLKMCKIFVARLETHAWRPKGQKSEQQPRSNQTPNKNRNGARTQHLTAASLPQREPDFKPCRVVAVVARVLEKLFHLLGKARPRAWPGRKRTSRSNGEVLQQRLTGCRQKRGRVIADDAQRAPRPDTQRLLRGTKEQKLRL